MAVTGHRVSPPLYESIELLGRERTLARLAQAIKAALALTGPLGAGVPGAWKAILETGIAPIKSLLDY